MYVTEENFVHFFVEYCEFITIVLLVVLYGCETWSLTSREERRLRVFESRVLRRIFGPKRDEVTGEWRKLDNGEIMICTAHQILFGWQNWEEWDGRGMYRGWGRKGVYRLLVGKPEGKPPLWRPRRRWEDNIKMDLQEVECGGMDWIDLNFDRDSWRVFVNTVMKLRA